MARKSTAAVFFLLTASVCWFLGGCGGEDSTAPATTGLATVETDTIVADVGATSAWVGGRVLDDGNDTVTGRGFCWSTDPLPTVADDTVSLGADIGYFSTKLKGLRPGTNCNFRAFGINGSGAAYGDPVSFTTLPGSETVTDIDGNIYHTVTIGNQVWMKENLRVTHFADGTAIANVMKPDWYLYPFAAYCNYLDDPAWSTQFGCLYNWKALLDPKELAPEGWRVAHDNDWKILEMQAGLSDLEADQAGWRGTDAGANLKEAGFEHWLIPNTGATDALGFSAIPGGYRGDGGHEGAIQLVGYYWTSTWDPNGGVFEDNAFFRRVDSYRTDIFRGVLPKGAGLSVRCIKETQ